jgi:putative hydrolase of the HAD superfamily
MTTRAVCFDATGTLFEVAESVGTTYSRAAAAAGVKLPAWRLDDAFARVLRSSPPLARAALASASRAEREAAERAWWAERIRQIFQATDSTVRFADPAAFAAGLFEHYRRAAAWRVRPGVVELLTTLRAEGLRLVVVSHFDHRLPDILEALDLKRFFARIEIPVEHARAKPDPALFHDLAIALGLDALAYVGDDAPEVLAAIAELGIRVYDVRDFPDLAPLAERLLADGGAGTAKLGRPATSS